MFNHKIASLEARIARLEANLSRKASLEDQPNQYEILEEIVDAVQGIIRRTYKPNPRYLIQPSTIHNSVEAIIDFLPEGSEHLDIFITSTKRGIYITGYMWIDQILDLSFKRGDNSWKFKVPAIIKSSREKYSKKNSKKRVQRQEKREREDLNPNKVFYYKK